MILKPNPGMIGLYTQAAFYIIAGINHFWHPDMYRRIMPTWLPGQHWLIVIRGICEILFGILLIPPHTKGFAAWMLIITLIAIFPANIQMTLNFMRYHSPYTWLTILRLPVQILLIWWVSQYT